MLNICSASQLLRGNRMVAPQLFKAMSMDRESCYMYSAIMNA